MDQPEHPNLAKAREYREKAREALRRAACCDNSDVKDAWMVMANTYLELGRLLEQQVQEKR